MSTPPSAAREEKTEFEVGMSIDRKSTTFFQKPLDFYSAPFDDYMEKSFLSRPGWARRRSLDAVPKSSVSVNAARSETLNITGNEVKNSKAASSGIQLMAETVVSRLITNLPFITQPGTNQNHLLHASAKSLLNFPLSIVLRPLLQELETLARNPSFNSQLDWVSIEILRSQLFLLQTITACTTQHWRQNPSQDPSPLSEDVSNQLLGLCLTFLKNDEASSTLYNSSQSIASLSQSSLSNSTPPSPPASSSRGVVTQEIYRNAGMITYFLSASNWTEVFGRIKFRITQYANEDEDLVELRLLEVCCLNRTRLVAVIQELNQNFIHLRKPAQASMSVVFRRAIWSWIESFPREFDEMSNSGRRMEGGVETLFDVIYILSESSDRRKAFAYPLLSMLLTLMPDILEKLEGGGRSAGIIKKLQFFENLRKALKGSKLSEIAATCFVDLIAAAASTNDLDTPLRLLVSDIDSDLKSKLLDPTRTFLNPDGLPNLKLMIDAWVALFKLDPTLTFPSLLSVLSSQASETSRLAGLNGILALVEDKSIVDNALDSVSSVLHALLVESGQRAEILSVVLKIWMAKPNLFFVTERPSMLSIDSLSTLLGAGDRSLRSLACSTLLALHRSESVSSQTKATWLKSSSQSIRGFVVEAVQEQVDERIAVELLSLDLNLQNTIPAGTWSSLECSLLITLCSFDQATRISAIQACKRLTQLGEQDPILKVLNTSVSDDSISWIPFSTVRDSSVGLFQAFDEGLSRWKALATIIYQRSDDESVASSSITRRREKLELGTQEQQVDQWARLTTFLVAALGKDASSGGGLSSVRGVDRDARARVSDRFIQELVDLLVSDDAIMHDAARDSIATVLHPDLYNLLFIQFNTIIGHFLENDSNGGDVGSNESSAVFSHFVEETVALLLLMSDKVTVHGDLVSSRHLEKLLVSITTFIRMARSKEISLKIQTCQLIKMLKVTEGRMLLLEQVINWYGQSNLNQAALRLQALEALSTILPNLIITTSKTLVTDSRLFNRYFDFFTHTLSQLSHNGNRAESATLKVLVISCLSSLLSANPSPGTERFREMALHSDLSLRAANLEILSNVLQSGMTLESLDGQSSTNPISSLFAMIREPNLQIALAMCEIAPASSYDDLSDIFLKLFDSRQTISFLKKIIEIEVTQTGNESELFRGNNFCTRILTGYARAAGYTYLRNTLEELIHSLCESPPEFSLDFDAQRSDVGTKPDSEVTKRLEKLTEAFLVTISASVDQVPIQIRELAHHIGEVVSKKYPESVFTAIGGLIFLRWINPTILSPEIIDLNLPSDSRDIRRGLLMVTKVLQALSNNVRFGAKEPGMRALNEFCDDQIFGMTRFLQAISNYDSAEEASTSSHCDETGTELLTDSEDRTLRSFLLENREKMRVVLTRHSASPASEPIWNQLDKVLQSFTVPSLIVEGAINETREAFMHRNGARPLNFELWNTIFYLVPKTGSTTFCLVLRAIESGTTDFESLIYFILLRLSDITTSFELLIDCTGFKSTNEIDNMWILLLFRLIPPSLSELLNRTILCNPNSSLKRALRTVTRLSAFDRLDARRIVGFSGAAEMMQYRSDALEILPRSTSDLIREERTTFDGISQLFNFKVEHPVEISIGVKSIVITTSKKHDLFADFKSTLIDELRFDQVESVTHFSSLVRGEGIEIESAAGILRFGVPNKEQRERLYRALMQGRASASTITGLLVRQPQQTRPIAVLINAVLYNLSSSTDSLRGRAHTLLCSLARVVKMEGAEVDLHPHDGIYLPESHSNLISTISDRFSIASPAYSLAFIDECTYTISIASLDELPTFIHALRPFLHNLHNLGYTARSERAAVEASIKAFVRQLFLISLRQPLVYSILQNRVFQILGKVEFILPFVLDEALLTVQSLELSGSRESQLKLPGQILATTSASSSAGFYLRTKIITRFRLALSRTAVNPASSLASSDEWSEIQGLLQLLLPLSFDAPSTALNLAETFHIYTSICYSGTPSSRIIAHQILINSIHSLINEATASHALRKALASLPKPSKELVLPAGELKTIVAVLSDIIEFGIPSIDYANATRSRWSSLVSSTCFQKSPAQCSSFVVLSALGQEVDGDLIYQILSIFRNSISDPSEMALTVEVINCLTRTLPRQSQSGSSDFNFFAAVWWISIGAISMKRSTVSLAAISLLTVTLEALSSLKIFETRSVAKVLLEHRQPEMMRLDDIGSIDFTVSFSFSLVSLLYEHLATPAAIELLSTLLEAGKQDDESFVLALLSSAAGISYLKKRYNLPQSSSATSTPLLLISKVRESIDLRNKDLVLLSSALLASLGQRYDDDESTLVIYGVLSALVSSRPDLAILLRDSLAPRLNAILYTSSNPQLLEFATILIVASSRKSETGSEPATTLARLGFPALHDLSSNQYLPLPAVERIGEACSVAISNSLML